MTGERCNSYLIIQPCHHRRDRSHVEPLSTRTENRFKREHQWQLRGDDRSLNSSGLREFEKLSFKRTFKLHQCLQLRIGTRALVLRVCLLRHAEALSDLRLGKTLA